MLYPEKICIALLCLVFTDPLTQFTSWFLQKVFCFTCNNVTWLQLGIGLALSIYQLCSLWNDYLYITKKLFDLYCINFTSFNTRMQFHPHQGFVWFNEGDLLILKSSYFSGMYLSMYLVLEICAWQIYAKDQLKCWIYCCTLGYFAISLCGSLHNYRWIRSSGLGLGLGDTAIFGIMIDTKATIHDMNTSRYLN